MSLGDLFEMEGFDDITNIVASKSVAVMGNALNITTTFAGKLVSGILSFIIAIYVLAYKEKLGAIARRTTIAFLPEGIAETVLDVAQLSYTTFYNFITGQLTEAVILGSLCYIGMLIFRFPYSAAIGMLVGITSLIPIVGAFIGTIIGAFLIIMVSPLKALLFVVFLLVLQQIEGNLIYPKVVGKSVGLPDILVIIAVLIGGRIGGISAVLMSVPVCSILYSLFKTQLEQKDKCIDNK
jgi:predicted PurR-regulated permease PerM